MAKKIIYAKGTGIKSDFVYVDLLPDVKRSREFNINVIIVVTIAVVLSFVFIYIPYSSATVVFEESNGLNNDLTHELLLTQEEYAGYEIDLNDLKDDLEIVIDVYDGYLNKIIYNAESRTIEVTIQMTTRLMYDTLNNSLLNISWVENSEYIAPRLLSNGIMYESTFTIGVEENAE